MDIGLNLNLGVRAIANAIAGSVSSRVKDLFNAFNTDSTFSGPDTVTTDYLGVLQISTDTRGAIKGARFSAGDWFDDDGSGNSLQPFQVVNGIKQWIYHDPATINTAVAVGDFRSAIASDGTERYYTIATGDDGTTGGALPTFPTSGTVADGTATWTYAGWHSIEGYVNEEARTNDFLNSQAAVTQVTTTTAQDYTVSVKEGAGSITLSGTMTGVVTLGNPVSAVAGAGALTCTVAGSVSYVNVEDGAFETSAIITAGAPVTRPATNLTRSTANWPNLAGGVSNDFLITGRVEPEAGGQDLKDVLSSQVDASNLSSVFLRTTNMRYQKTISGTPYQVVDLAVTPLAGVGIEYQVYQVSTAGFGMGISIKQDGGSWSSWTVLHDANGRSAAPVNADYQIGGRDSAVHFNGYYPGVAIHDLTGIADPQAYAESLR